MAKIALIGAGSLVFARNLITDILHHDALKDTHFALMDIATTGMDYTRRIAERIIKEQKLPATVTTTTDRREALKDADFVIIMILPHGYDPIEVEYKIPMKHGVDQCITDTLGPGGVFRFLRAAPMILDICRDVAEVAKPNCYVLNYTNPMAMLTWMAYKMLPQVNFVGLCHSVQYTIEQLSKVIGIPHQEVRFWIAGINHQAWVLQFADKTGKDLYPLLNEKIYKSDLYGIDKDESEMVRIEMLRALGYFVTESSGHNSEYNPWFRKRDDLIKKYTGPAWSGESGYILKAYGSERENYGQEQEKLLADPEPLEFKAGREYGSYIINSIYTDTALRINGNIRNDGLITNLPHGCCVEVPCLVDGTGIHGCYVGDLPTQCAALNRTNVNLQELAVQGYINKSREAIYHAICYDPLTGAKLSLEEIRAMVDEMFEIESARGWLPELK